MTVIAQTYLKFELYEIFTERDCGTTGFCELLGTSPPKFRETATKSWYRINSLFMRVVCEKVP